MPLERGKLPIIDCNVQQMVTFFHHIISKSIVHCERKPEVGIRCKTGSRLCHISITDNGIGIEEKYLSNIFIPFNHLHPKDSHE